MRYRILGFVVETDVVLDLDQVLEPVLPDVTFQQLTAELREAVVVFPFHTLKQTDGSYWQSWSKSEHGYRLQYFDYGIFWISPDGRHIRGFLYPETPANTFQHILLDQVLPYAATLRGERVLHAGGFVSDGQAVVFLGEGGQGKSTLTASFGAVGYPLLADDSLRLRVGADAVWGIGSYPGVRLWEDSADSVAPAQPWTPVAHYTEKRRLSAAPGGVSFYSDPAPIKRLYVLDADTVGSVQIEPLTANERFIYLLRHSFRFDITDRQRTQREFETLTQLAVRLPIYRLRYPRRYDFLPHVRQAILDHLETHDHDHLDPSRQSPSTHPLPTDH